jgi:transmembrane sensor
MPESKEYYQSLPAKELLSDEFFIESIKNPGPASIAFWNEFLVLYPEKRTEIDEAAAFLNGLKFSDYKAGSGVKERIWENVIARESQKPKVVSLNSRWWYRAAAAVAAIAVMTTVWMLMGESNNQISTQYSEVKKVSLPDQSEVVLNANSSIQYKKKWKKGVPREVWLKGEAFFEVKHLNTPGQPVLEDEKFIVHAGDLKVQVLGTSFNVNNREQLTEVVLHSGSVQVNFENNPGIILKPGERITYNPETKEVTKSIITSQDKIAWKNKELRLDNTSLRDLVSRIENYYGYQVKVEDEKILDRQVSGTGASGFSLDDEAALFRSLEIILNIEIIKKDKTLYIRNR